MSQSNDSILVSIKKLLGIDAECTDFDMDIIIHINTVIVILRDLGVTPEPETFKITSDSETWNDYLGDDLTLYESVKTYIYLKVRMYFDPPTNGTHAQAIEKQIAELEWRLNVLYENAKE